MYMRENWVQVHKSLFFYRYVVWCITVPLLMNEFNLIFCPPACARVSPQYSRPMAGT